MKKRRSNATIRNKLLAKIMESVCDTHRMRLTLWCESHEKPNMLQFHKIAKRLYNCPLWSSWSYFFFFCIDSFTTTHRFNTHTKKKYGAFFRAHGILLFICDARIVLAVVFIFRPKQIFLTIDFNAFIPFAHVVLLQLFVFSLCRDETLKRFMLKYGLVLLWTAIVMWLVFVISFNLYTIEVKYIIWTDAVLNMFAISKLLMS